MKKMVIIWVITMAFVTGAMYLIVFQGVAMVRGAMQANTQLPSFQKLFCEVGFFIDQYFIICWIICAIVAFGLIRCCTSKKPEKTK